MTQGMTQEMTRKGKDGEQGFALLLVFLMAAAIGLMLYQQLPRVAFETEREKEQLLIDRGEQYKRAIQLYVTANRRFPSSIEDLENKDKRFLRRRYVDPYTGKEEWRLIHGNGQTLTDSLIQTAPNATGNSTNAQQQTPGATTPDGQPAVNAAVLQRPSDRALIPPPGVTFVSGDANNPAADPRNAPLPPITLTPAGGQNQGGPNQGGPNQAGGAPGNQPFPPIGLAPNNAGNQALPPITLTPGQAQGITFGAPGGPTAVNAPVNQLGVPQFPGQQVLGQPPGGGLPGGVQVQPGFRIDANGQPVPINQGVNGTPAGLPPGVPGAPGQAPQGATNAALGLINQILTTPRAPAPQNTAIATQSTTFGAGIAGVASTHTGPSIKVYNDQSEYQLWEFVYQAVGGVGGGPQGNTPPRTPGNPPPTTPGATPPQTQRQR